MSSPEFGFTAQQIISEGRTTQEDVKLLKEWLETENLPTLIDEQVILFLLSCDNNRELTKATIKAHYSIKQKTSEVFDNRIVDRADLQKNFNVSHVCVLPERTDDGCAILVSKLNDTNYRFTDTKCYLTNLLMAIDLALYEYPPNGLIILYDLKGIGFMHMVKTNVRLFKTYIHYLQEGLPVKLKALHLLNCYSIVDTILGIVKPFLKKEVIERIRIHSSDAELTEFYNAGIPKRCLPEDYGGDLPSVSALHKEHIKKLTEIQSFFDAEEQQRNNSPNLGLR